MQNNKGLKYDSGKPPLSIIPKEALYTEAQVFAFGAKKYERNNFKLGMAYTRLIDAALRHIVCFNDGEDLDPESGLSHLAHARCCLAMLLYFTENKAGIDDRYRPELASSEMQCNEVTNNEKEGK